MKVKTIITGFLVLTMTMLLPVWGVPKAAADPGQNENAIPANKTAVVASKRIVFQGTLGGFESKTVTLASETVRTPDGGSLLGKLTAECFIGGYDLDAILGIDHRSAVVEVWVEVDGKTAKVFSHRKWRNRVNFCDRELFQLKAFLGIDFQLEKFSGAYAFNWPMLDLSAGTHLVEVKAKLKTFVLSEDYIPDEGILAVIGKRTFVIEPIHVRVDETLGDDTPKPTSLPVAEGNLSLDGVKDDRYPSVRYKSFGNTNSGEIYLGYHDLGGNGAADRVEDNSNFWADGTYHVKFSYDSYTGILKTTVENSANVTLNYIVSVDGPLASPDCPVGAWDALEILVFNRDTGTTVNLNNVTIDGIPVIGPDNGNFIGGSGFIEGDGLWLVPYAFGDDFKIEADLEIAGPFSSTSENGKAQFIVGCTP